MRPPQEAMMGGPEGPITFEMLMQLRNAARNKGPESGGPAGLQGSGLQGLQGAAQRRLENGPPVSSEHSEMMPPEEEGAIVGDQSPEDLMVADLQESLDAVIEPPDITQTAATTMMRYGAIQEYLMRARGEVPNA